MARLGSGTLGGVPPTVRRPAYDRAALKVGMAHLGVGAFHRCHQSEFADDALEAEFGPWGEVGISIRAPRVEPTLGRQDGLYTRALRNEDEVELRVIGAMREVVDAQDDVERAITALADPRIAIVTMTVTEKGYCHRPATGQLDPDHPDILNDLAPGTVPRTVPGVLVEALRRRQKSGAGGVTLMSCDNIPANGRILRNVVTTVTAHKYPDLCGWVAGKVHFPSSMVDRIVPATTERDIAFARERLGLDDEAAVVGEPFRQWVIENDFAGARPRWEAAGVEIVSDVEPYELIKMQVLNAAQSAMSYFGALAGLDFTFEDVRDPLIARYVRHMLTEETAPGLPRGAMDVPSYIDLSFRRLLNRAIRHRNHQIATDGSQKIVQRLLNPIRNCMARDASFELLAGAVAAWMAYLLAASTRFGARWTPSDPWADRVRAIGDETGPDAAVLVRRILAIDAVFGADLPHNKAFAAALARHLAGFLSGDSQGHLGATLDASVAQG